MNHRAVFATLVASLVAASGTAFAATPQEGVEQEIRRGLYTETDLGTYFDFSGNTVSNAEAYLQLGIGYDITSHISLSFEFGLGASAGLCLGQIDPTSGNCESKYTNPNTGTNDVLPANFSNEFYQLQFTYYVNLTERLVLAPRIMVGYQNMDPAPLENDVQNASGNLGTISGGPMGGVGLGIEYATHMDHFTVGLDFAGRFVVGPNVTSIAIFPRVKYTF